MQDFLVSISEGEATAQSSVLTELRCSFEFEVQSC